jgi:hypothetical protein
MYLLYDTNNRGSDTSDTPLDRSDNGQLGSPQQQGDSFDNGTGLPETDMEKLIRKSRESAARRNAAGLPETMDETGIKDRANLTPYLFNPVDAHMNELGKQSVQEQNQQPKQRNLLNRTMDISQRNGKQGEGGPLTPLQKKLGKLGEFTDRSEANKQRVKEKYQEKTEDYVKDKIGKKIGNEAFSKGFERGAGKALATGAKSAAKTAAKEATSTAAKAGVQAGAKVGAQAATKGIQAGISAAGVGTGAASFGLGLVLSFLLNIAISLGISDAVDAAFEAMPGGDDKKGKFLAIRAAMSVGMFVLLLLCFGLVLSVAGIVIGIPVLIIINIYMIIGMFFPDVAVFQGYHKTWEKIIILMLDIWASMVLLTVLAVIIWYICATSEVGSGSLSDWITWLLAKSDTGAIIQWVTGIDYNSISQFCGTILNI